jgi:hypothetical protein
MTWVKVPKSLECFRKSGNRFSDKKHEQSKTQSGFKRSGYHFALRKRVKSKTQSRSESPPKQERL